MWKIQAQLARGRPLMKSRSQGKEGGQGFCDDNTKASVINSVTIGGEFKIVQIA